jgi:cAMP-dependent protein kinase regulator
MCEILYLRSVKKVVPKSDEAISHIDAKLRVNFLFQHLDPEGRKDLCDAVFEVKYKCGDVIIQQVSPSLSPVRYSLISPIFLLMFIQFFSTCFLFVHEIKGGQGDNFYIVEHGTCDIYVGETKVMVCNSGDSFGELALMYNAPRAATVKAATDVVVWAMDRITFKLTLMDHTLKKRERYEAFLEDVPILGSLLKYERLTIADALVPQEFHKGDKIITQGESGDKFYIIESGACDFVINGNKVGEVEEGGYFGELALLHNKPRAATVQVSSSKAKVLALDRSTFTGVMGSLHSILKRNGEQYTKYMLEMK